MTCEEMFNPVNVCCVSTVILLIVGLALLVVDNAISNYFKE